VGFNQHDRYVTTKQELEDYIGRTMDRGGDVKKTIENMKKKEFKKPDDPAADCGETDKEIWKKQVANYVIRLNMLETNLETVFTIIWGQCTPALQAKLEALSTFADIKDRYDAIDLLKAIKGITFKFEDQRYPQQSLYNAWRSFYLYKQKPEDSNAQYLEQFTNTVDVLEQYGGTFGMDLLLHSECGMSLLDDDEMKAVKQAREIMEPIIKKAKTTYLAYAFLAKSDNDRFGKLKEELQNDFTKKQRNYPETITDTYNLLTSYKTYKPRNQDRQGTGNMSFNNVNNNNR
jgi:hypothetical protein